ncbi:MAG: GNAT family N-acetyltransferase [Chloroflexota bacterium]|nr:GNAT family N-acetyltransferase [Chloroflexota bacterium]
MIPAIIPAAGLSTRMGGDVPKPLLPWGDRTVIEAVVTAALQAGATPKLSVVVTGHRHQEIEAVLKDHPVRCVFNPAYQQKELLSSLQIALQALPETCTGALLALADQPQVGPSVIAGILDTFLGTGQRHIVVPSYQMRRGHPIVLPRWLWQNVLKLPAGATLRTLIEEYTENIHYLVVDTPVVLQDLDTPQQYQKALAAQTKSNGALMSTQPTLTTERLVLRPFSILDGPQVQHLAGNPAVAATTQNIPHPYEDGMAESWISTHEDLFAGDQGIVFAVTLRDGGDLVGTISLLGLNRGDRFAELGYWIGLPYWNRGFATEAAQALIAYGFSGLNLNRIQARHMTRNMASGRVMEKTGMQCEGVLRQRIFKNGRFEDMRLFSILRSEYRG